MNKEIKKHFTQVVYHLQIVTQHLKTLDPLLAKELEKLQLKIINKYL